MKIFPKLQCKYAKKNLEKVKELKAQDRYSISVYDKIYTAG